MSARLECQFSLVRYVADPVKNEFVNIGVVVRGEGATAVRFTRDWSRVRCLDPDADVGMLESLEEEMRARLEDVAGGTADRLEKPLWEMLDDSLSNSVQLSESKGCLAATTVRAEVEDLLRMYVETAPRRNVARNAGGRLALHRQMRGDFERAGVWPLMRKRIAAATYTQAGDALRLDCGYRPNGVIRMFHAVSLLNDADAAKVLAFTAPGLEQGVARVESAKLQLTAVVEPLARVLEDGEEAVAQYRFGVSVMEHAGLRVLTANDVERAAQTAREELRL